jgi:hypothetical protein
LKIATDPMGMIWTHALDWKRVQGAYAKDKVLRRLFKKRAGDAMTQVF